MRIEVGTPVSWKHPPPARAESGGVIEAFRGDDTVRANGLLAHAQGLRAESVPASPIANVITNQAEGVFHRGRLVVCALAGHGLKDPDFTVRQSGEPFRIAPAFQELAREFKVDLPR